VAPRARSMLIRSGLPESGSLRSEGERPPVQPGVKRAHGADVASGTMVSSSRAERCPGRHPAVQARHATTRPGPRPKSRTVAPPTAGSAPNPSSPDTLPRAGRQPALPGPPASPSRPAAEPGLTRRCQPRRSAPARDVFDRAWPERDHRQLSHESGTGSVTAVVRPAGQPTQG
jgi:hypothetical protein